LEREPEGPEKKMIVGALAVLLSVGSFTALQFRWLTEIAKA
jgi:hypothetical protein